MSIINSSFSNEVKSFVGNHNLLCVLTLGLAVVAYSLGNLLGRGASWIIECKGTTKKTAEISVEKFSSSSNHLESVKQLRTDPLPQENDIEVSFRAFITELENEIFPFYEKHEQGFDKFSIHGRMHVARAVIFGEVMARYYQEKSVPVDFNYVRRTIGLHDAGREGNGIDQWEQESSDLLCQHLVSKGVSREEAGQKSKIIIKDKDPQDSIEYIIFQSADCLDIMRPCTGRGGKDGFDTNYLKFLHGCKLLTEEWLFRNRLIEEAWKFIEITEKLKMTHFNNNEGFMEKLFQIIKDNRPKLPILSSIL
jgi:hypothetical protein